MRNIKQIRRFKGGDFPSKNGYNNDRNTSGTLHVIGNYLISISINTYKLRTLMSRNKGEKPIYTIYSPSRLNYEVMSELNGQTDTYDSYYMSYRL